MRPLLIQLSSLQFKMPFGDPLHQIRQLRMHRLNALESLLNSHTKISCCTPAAQATEGRIRRTWRFHRIVAIIAPRLQDAVRQFPNQLYKTRRVSVSKSMEVFRRTSPFS
jgi:hypothetical protein